MSYSVFMAKQNRHFPVLVTAAEEGGFIVTCPVLEGCYSQGETIEEALKNIQEAISLCLEDLNEKNIQVAEETEVSLHFVSLQV